MKHRLQYFDCDKIPKLKKILNSLLIKPSGPDCNLDCTYCFYLDRAKLFPETKKHRMSLSTLEEVTKQTMQQGGSQISLAWQGGEPTLMGLPFFRKAVEFQQKYGGGKTVGNGFQTNGLLLDKEWAAFFKKYNFLVGLSLDGPDHIHDRYRTAKGGQGSWKQVEESARMLLDVGVTTNALVVVNDYSVNFPKEIYAYHKALGLNYMQFIPCVETDPKDPTKAASYSVTAEKYGEFLTKVFDLWHADIADGVASTSVRYFDSVFHSYVGLEAPDCTLLKSCGAYLVVEHTGDVYACDFFVENQWKLGNIRTHKLETMLNSPRQQEFGDMKAAVPVECTTCEWLNKCRGGCTKDRVRDPQDNGSNHFCESYKIYFAHADKNLTILAAQWLVKQQR
jgi:uncharacterized protein